MSDMLNTRFELMSDVMRLREMSEMTELSRIAFYMGAQIVVDCLLNNKASIMELMAELEAESARLKIKFDGESNET